MFSIVCHYNEGEEERVVIFGSQKYVLGQVCLHQVVIMYEEVAPIRVQDDESEVGPFIKELQPSRLPLRQVLDLANHMLGICAIFNLVLREL